MPKRTAKTAEVAPPAKSDAIDRIVQFSLQCEKFARQMDGTEQLAVPAGVAACLAGAQAALDRALDERRVSVDPTATGWLPDDVLRIVLGNLSGTALTNARLVCRDWARIGAQAVRRVAFPTNWFGKMPDEVVRLFPRPNYVYINKRKMTDEPRFPDPRRDKAVSMIRTWYTNNAELIVHHKTNHDTFFNPVRQLIRDAAPSFSSAIYSTISRRELFRFEIEQLQCHCEKWFGETTHKYVSSPDVLFWPVNVRRPLSCCPSFFGAKILVLDIAKSGTYNEIVCSISDYLADPRSASTIVICHDDPFESGKAAQIRELVNSPRIVLANLSLGAIVSRPYEHRDFFRWLRQRTQ